MTPNALSGHEDFAISRDVERHKPKNGQVRGMRIPKNLPRFN
jgi:hypothetical protein